MKNKKDKELTGKPFLLKPCPFCGGIELGVMRLKENKTGKLFYRIHCENCRAKGPLVPESEEASAKIWNIRINIKNNGGQKV